MVGLGLIEVRVRVQPCSHSVSSVSIDLRHMCLCVCLSHQWSVLSLHPQELSESALPHSHPNNAFCHYHVPADSMAYEHSNAVHAAVLRRTSQQVLPPEGFHQKSDRKNKYTNCLTDASLRFVAKHARLS